MGTLTRIETVANGLLNFKGSKYCTLEISKQELEELQQAVLEEYDDVLLSATDFDCMYWSMELNSILFTLKIK